MIRVLYVIGVFIMCSSFTKNKFIKKDIESRGYFFCDVALSKKGYFTSLLKGNGYSMIKNQNDIYEKKSLDFETLIHIQIGKGKIKYKIIKKMSGENYIFCFYSLYYLDESLDTDLYDYKS